MNKPITLSLVKFDDIKSKAVAAVSAIDLTKPVGIFDEKGIKKAKQNHAAVKKVSNDIEAIRVEVKAPALEFGRAVDARAKELQAAIAPQLAAAKKIIDDVERERQAYMLKRRNEREKSLTDAGATFAAGAYRCGTLVYTAEILDIDDDAAFAAVVDAVAAEKVKVDADLAAFQALQQQRAKEVVQQPTAQATSAASPPRGFDFFAPSEEYKSPAALDEYRRGADAMREIAIAAIQKYSKRSEMIAEIKNANV
jgi:hypothetical protein